MARCLKLDHLARTTYRLRIKPAKPQVLATGVSLMIHLISVDTSLISDAQALFLGFQLTFFVSFPANIPFAAKYLRTFPLGRQRAISD
jgi:hypothetical protein